MSFKSIKKSEQIFKSTCRMCHGVCGVLVHMKDGKVVQVAGDPDCPTSLGYTCTKGRASVELLYHPDRLRYPLKRVAGRGENQWQRISWGEALDTIARKFLKYKQDFGAESVVTAVGTGRPQVTLMMRFTNCFGSPNHLSIVNNCYFPRIMASSLTSGRFPVCDYYGFGGLYPKCVLVWGCNITETGASDGMCGYQLTRTLKNGAKLIVVDPRKTDLAAKADHWLQIRPGSDDALVLAMLHIIIKENLYDKDFVENWTIGFNDLSERVKDFTPEKAAEITWIPVESIRKAARLYATTKPACIQWGNGLDQNINTFQTVRAIHCLSAITGNLDIPGGDIFLVPPAYIVAYTLHGGIPIDMGKLITPELKKKRIGFGKYRVLDTFVIHPRNLLDQIESEKPYPVKALFVMGSNMLLNQTDPLRTARALKKIDFTIVTELFMTPTAQLADIVLPAASWLETDDVVDTHIGWCVLLRQKIAQIGECRDDKQILFDLAHRLGMSHYFPWKNVREYCDWILNGAGINFKEFKQVGIIRSNMRYRKYLAEGFNTPSGKVELRCSTLEAMGYDPLPYYAEPPESPFSTPDLYKDYPLIITIGSRLQGFFCSEGRQIPSLRRLNPDPLIEIHPQTAHSFGIENGDWVWVESLRGRIKQKAYLTDGLRPGVVHAQHGWWFPEKIRQSMDSRNLM